MIEAVDVDINGVTIKRLVYPDRAPFWAAGWAIGTSKVLSYTVYNEDADNNGAVISIDGPKYINKEQTIKYTGFGMRSDEYSYQDFLEEIENRGLTLPE